jgi:hypothetical protein
MDSTQVLRFSLGFLFAPAVGLSAFGVLWCVGYPAQSFTYCTPGTLAIVGVGALFAYPAAIFLGIPVFMVFYKRRWLKLWHVVVATTLIGAVSTVPLLFLAGKGPIVALKYLPISSAVGLVSGVTFWLVAIFRNRALTPGSRGDAPPAARA